jgi:hypothetical protein
MRLAKLGIVPAALITLAAATTATAATTPPPVYMTGQWGLVELPIKACFQRSKAALTGQKLNPTFAKYYPFPGGYPQSVAVGTLGPAGAPYTTAAVKCVAGGPKGQSFFSVDVASSVKDGVQDLTNRITDALFGSTSTAPARVAGPRKQNVGSF